MKKNIRFLFCLCTALPLLLCAPSAALSNNLEIPILMYHHLAEQGPYDNLTLSPKAFSAHMTWLWDNGFTAILPSELPLIAAGELPMPQRPVVITFDDGYESNYELAFPILKETGMRAGLAVVTSMMGEGHWGMTWDHIREMSASGLCEFGSHSDNLHDSMGPFAQKGVLRRQGETKDQYLARVVPDLQTSATKIETELGRPCVWLSYPFGVTDPWLDEYLASSGMFPVTTIIGGKAADLKNGTRNLNRVRVGEKEPPWKDKAIRKVLGRKTKARGANVSVCAAGKTLSLGAYNVDGTTYVRLRDLALLMSGTKRTFEVGWDAEKRRVSLTTGVPYTVRGGEMSAAAGDVDEAVPRNLPLLLDGRDTPVTGYNIHDTNYVNLRWLSQLMDFSVSWDEAGRTVVIQ